MWATNGPITWCCRLCSKASATALLTRGRSRCLLLENLLLEIRELWVLKKIYFCWRFSRLGPGIGICLIVELWKPDSMCRLIISSHPQSSRPPAARNSIKCCATPPCQQTLLFIESWEKASCKVFPLFSKTPKIPLLKGRFRWNWLLHFTVW